MLVEPAADGCCGLCFELRPPSTGAATTGSNLSSLVGSGAGAAAPATIVGGEPRPAPGLEPMPPRLAALEPGRVFLPGNHKPAVVQPLPRAQASSSTATTLTPTPTPIKMNSTSLSLSSVLVSVSSPSRSAVVLGGGGDGDGDPGDAGGGGCGEPGGGSEGEAGTTTIVTDGCATVTAPERLLPTVVAYAAVSIFAETRAAAPLAPNGNTPSRTVTSTPKACSLDVAPE